MTIRTLSQLPPCGSTVTKNSLFEVSVPNGERYISKSQTIGNLGDQLGSEISSNITRQFDMLSGSEKFSVAGLSSAIHALSSEDATLVGTKEFTSIPAVTTSLTSYQVSHTGAGGMTFSPDQLVPNVMKVKSLIGDHANFIGSESVIDGDPGSDEAPRFTLKNDEFMYFRMDDNGTDSSMWIDPETNAKAGPATCTRSGYLTLFGWLADNGNVLAQDAWVALYGQILLAGTSSAAAQYSWVPLQVQPWIIGARSSIRQYVGFNLPVKEGLRLKIKTGFRVNGSTAAMQDESTKSFNLNEPNCFVGWIVHSA